MRNAVVGFVVVLAVASVSFRNSASAQAPARGAVPAGQGTAPAAGRARVVPQPVFKLEDNFLEWRLQPSEKVYETIEPKRLMGYVNDLAAISRRYRDAGHPQFWGRIIGTSADRETADWLMARFKQIGLTDVHDESIDLAPQWFPQSWEVTATGAGKSLTLTTAQPSYNSTGTTGSGLDLEVVYAGLGSEADFIGRDVRGKAVLLFSNPMPGSWRHTATQEGAIQRTLQKGAAAIIVSIQLPPVVGMSGDAGAGNIRTQLYPTGTNVPTFSLGMKDGMDFRTMIGEAPAGQPVRLEVRLDVQQVPNLKTSTVWGTLPGTTSEVIYVEAHRDGWFESATDNASGVATMLGIAEYFAKVPQAQRRRTIKFIGTSGHHNSGPNSVTWLVEHQAELFKNAALLINCEHTSAADLNLLGEAIRVVNSEAGFLWYGGGNQRPKLQEVAYKAFQQFGLPIYAEPEPGTPGGEASRLYGFVPAVQASNYNMFFHSDAEVPYTVTPHGLVASARAYAKVIEEVNKMELKDLQLPAPPPAAGRGATAR